VNKGRLLASGTGQYHEGTLWSDTQNVAHGSSRWSIARYVYAFRWSKAVLIASSKGGAAFLGTAVVSIVPDFISGILFEVGAAIFQTVHPLLYLTEMPNTMLYTIPCGWSRSPPRINRQCSIAFHAVGADPLQEPTDNARHVTHGETTPCARFTTDFSCMSTSILTL
jgi:hypothetical protein